MANIIDNYNNFTKDILKRIGILKTKQLVICLKKKFDIDDEKALFILKGLQKNRRLFMSQDGWTMTPGTYLQLTGDKFYDKTTTNPVDFAITFDIGKTLNIDNDIVDSMWAVAYAMPESEEFIITNYPWKMCYITKASEEKQGILYQILVVRKGDEFATNMMLKSLPNITSRGMRNALRRIAIIEDERHAWAIAHLGFETIYAVDETSPDGLRILEKRESDDIWSDYKEAKEDE